MIAPTSPGMCYAWFRISSSLSPSPACIYHTSKYEVHGSTYVPYACVQRTAHLYSGSSMGSVPEILIFPDMVTTAMQLMGAACSPIQTRAARCCSCRCYPGRRLLRALILRLRDGIFFVANGRTSKKRGGKVVTYVSHEVGRVRGATLGYLVKG